MIEVTFSKIDKLMCDKPEMKNKIFVEIPAEFHELKFLLKIPNN